MAYQLITKQSEAKRRLNQRKAILESRLAKVEDPNIGHAMEAAIRELELNTIPNAKFGKDYDLRKVTKQTNSGKAIREFLNTGDYANAFINRQRYEIDAGRDMEPTLFEAIYNVVVDSTLPKSITINTLGTTGVVFEEVPEGGEVKFATVGSGTKSVTIVRYGVGIQYTEDLFEFNELWRLPFLERQFGIAHNALLNNVHMTPILTYNYTGNNATAASSDGTTLVEKYLRTIEAGIQDSATDTTNSRPGPYALLVSSGDQFIVERALNRVPQQGVDLQSSAIDRIAAVVAYDGWTSSRGKKNTTYAGVSSGTAYLVHLPDRDIDFQSYFKNTLRRRAGEGDASRFIMAEEIYDVQFGVFADPKRAVQEITWPTS